MQQDKAAFLGGFPRINTRPQQGAEMAGHNGPTEKDIYRLWWEYLHRSENYKEISLWHQQGEDYSKLPEKFKKDYFLPELELGFFDQDHTLDDPKPISPITSFYSISGDIHKMSFYTWYRNMKKHANTARKNKAGKNNRKVIRNYLGSVRKDLLTCMDFLRLRHGREATARELIDFACKEFLCSPSRCIIEVNPFVIDSEGVQEAFGKYIRDWKKTDKENYERECNLYKLGVRPMGRIEYDGLVRYLKVYDVWKLNKTKWTPKVRNEIEFYKNYSKKADDENIRDAMKRDRDKALKIIFNSERGIFPGKY